MLLHFLYLISRRCNFTSFKPKMTTAQRTELEQKISVFAVSWTTEVNELKRNYAADINFRQNNDTSEHYSAIITYLLEVIFQLTANLFSCFDLYFTYQRLQNFTNFSLAMKSQRVKHNINPFKLHTKMGSYATWSISQEKLDADITPRPSFMLRMLSSNIANSKPVEVESTEPISIPGDFASRYSAEVAAPKKLKEYEEFAHNHKATLLAESKQLSQKYSEDLRTAMNIERTVVGNILLYCIKELELSYFFLSGVFDMLNQFIGLLRDQEEVIVDVHDSSIVATQYVQETDEQLLLTIERSKNYQRSTVAVIVIMGVFLLVLDAMTP